MAYKIRTCGHRDNIDNILYAVAYCRKMILLSMDTTFKKFLYEKGFDTKNFISHKELFAMT